MLLMLRRRRSQRGQALLIVLVFVAAFLLVVAAALRLASTGFLSLGEVQADTRSTYALDAGVPFAMEYLVVQGKPCTGAITPPPLTIPYPSGTTTVNVSVTPAPICDSGPPTWDLTVTASSTSRQLKAEVVLNGGLWSITWESFQ